MALERYYQESVMRNDCNKDESSSIEKWKSMSDDTISDNNTSGGFDCNICLDSVQDPVVTLCGHLYCWPCIYKWLHFQTISGENVDQKLPQCPVCKAEVSDTTLVPLYGRGMSSKSSEGKAPNLGLIIPQRPPGPAYWNSLSASNSFGPRPPQQLRNHSFLHQPQPYYPSQSYATSPMLGPGARTAQNTLHPIIVMFGEMVYARVFGNSVTNIYNYPNSYHLAGNSSPRVRRHIMQADKSLSRICFFLFCCIILCLILF